jgi:hypothetical protein
MPVGFGRPIDDPALPEMTRQGTAVFEDAVRLTGDALGIELDEVRCESEYAMTTEHLDLGSWSIEAGCVAGVAANWIGARDGKQVVQLKVRWRKGQTLEPDWQIEHGYVVEIEGLPSVRTKLEVFPPKDFVARSLADYMVLGMVMTAMPAVQAIPQVCDARPGIVTYLDLPLVTARGFTRR